MMEQRRGYRPQMRRATRRGEERDPYMVVLTAQIAVSVLLVLMGYSLRDAQPEQYQQFCAGYHQLISSQELRLPEDALSEYQQLKNGVADTAASWITNLLKRDPPSQGADAVEPQPTATEVPADGTNPEPEQPSSTASKPGSGADRPQIDTLAGAGGWMGVGKAGDGSFEVPASCALAPILLNVGVDPPVSGVVTSLYGFREHPLSGKDDFHRGVDIAAAQGTAIRASLPGTVVEHGSSPIYGNFITLDHGRGLTTTYCHCDTIVAQDGANLRQGELVATVGSTGISTGPHVHFEIAKNGKYYNPAWVLDGMETDGI